MYLVLLSDPLVQESLCLGPCIDQFLSGCFELNVCRIKRMPQLFVVHEHIKTFTKMRNTDRLRESTGRMSLMQGIIIITYM